MGEFIRIPEPSWRAGSHAAPAPDRAGTASRRRFGEVKLLDFGIARIQQDFRRERPDGGAASGAHRTRLAQVRAKILAG